MSKAGNRGSAERPVTPIAQIFKRSPPLGGSVAEQEENLASYYVERETFVQPIVGNLPGLFIHVGCVLAHYMADAQDDLREELRWDQLALDAASAAVPQEFDGRFPGMTLASFFPSLYLNLAADYEKLGDLALARKHAVMAAEAVPALDDSGLGSMTSAAIERLLGRLADAPQGHESD